MGDTQHHVRFLKKVLGHRNQNMQVVKSKFESFFAKRRNARSQHVHAQGQSKSRRVVSVKFDLVSKVHLYSRSCILASYKAAGVPGPRLVYSSLPKVMSRIYTKRSVIRKVKKRLTNTQN